MRENSILCVIVLIKFLTMEIKAFCEGYRDSTACPKRMRCNRFHLFMQEVARNNLGRTEQQTLDLMNSAMPAPFSKIVKSTGETECKYFASIE